MVDVNRGMARRPMQEPEKRPIAFYIRAKTGPDRRDWSPVGVAFERKDGKPGYTIKLNTLPISGWNGEMVMVPPFVEEDETGRDEAPAEIPGDPGPDIGEQSFSIEAPRRRSRAKEPDPTI